MSTEYIELNLKNMVNLKDRIIAILEQQNHSYSELAAHLQLSESDLDLALEDNSLEIRTLELISKALRIPLYSFFRESGKKNTTNTPYYDLNIWAPESVSLKNEVESLRKEVLQLKRQLHEKELLIDALKEQLMKS